MDLGVSAVVVGSISAVGSIIVAVIHTASKRQERALSQVREENREDHGLLQHQVGNLFRGLNRVEDLLTGHIRWHGNEGGSGGTIGRDQSRISEDHEVDAAS